MQPTIILVQPREQGNIGSVARAMANMGLERLLLVDPAPEIGGVARGFGVGGWHILDNLERHADLASAIASFEVIVGTSAIRQRRLGSIPVVTPRQFAEGQVSDFGRWAILFGPEDSGLSRGELGCCSSIVSIPCHTEHPTLNLAQAVLIVAYELQTRSGERSKEPSVSSPLGQLATAAERELLFERVSEVLEAVGYDQVQRRQSFLESLSPMANRAHLTRHELRTLLRLCNRIVGKSRPAVDSSE